MVGREDGEDLGGVNGQLGDGALEVIGSGGAGEDGAEGVAVALAGEGGIELLEDVLVELDGDELVGLVGDAHDAGVVTLEDGSNNTGDSSEGLAKQREVSKALDEGQGLTEDLDQSVGALGLDDNQTGGRVGTQGLEVLVGTDDLTKGLGQGQLQGEELGGELGQDGHLDVLLGLVGDGDQVGETGDAAGGHASRAMVDIEGTTPEGMPEGTAEGAGASAGRPEGRPEGMPEGTPAGTPEGVGISLGMTVGMPWGKPEGRPVGVLVGVEVEPVGRAAATEASSAMEAANFILV